jgi:hypothetical protein
MNANQLIEKLTWAEVNSQYAADCRKVIRDERMSLEVAVRSGDGARIKKATDEALRVANMWGVEV